MHPYVSIYVLTGWVVGVVMMVVLARRYSPAKAWGWVALIFAAPWVGLVLYLIFGDNPLGRRRLVRYRQITSGSQLKEKLAKLDRYRVGNRLDRVQAGTEQLAEAGGALGALGGNDLETITDSAGITRLLVADIDQAVHHVHLVFYIFLDDQTGRAVGEALIGAAGRGVCCRVIADAVGSHKMFPTLGRQMREAGVELFAALPINPLRRSVARFDLRNHRKVAVIDGQVAYLGSWNIADPTYGRDWCPPYHDIMVRLRGPAVAEAQLLFLEDLSYEAGALPENVDELFPDPQVAGDLAVQVLPSGPMYPSTPVRDIAVLAIHQAIRRVLLTTPYLVPDEALTLALRLAAQRGVQLDILLPERSDGRIVDAVGRSYVRQLVAEGANVYFYRGGVLHAKTLTVDDTVGMVGSANFDVRSFHLDVEANLLIYSHPAITALRNVQENYLHQCRRLDQDAIDRIGWPRKMVEDVAKLLSPLF